MITIKDKKDCCGCGACVQRCPKQCIAMQEDSEGFLYPRVNAEMCIDCGLCEKVCPVLNEVVADDAIAINTYAAINKNEGDRLASSSGGVFILLAEKVIAEGGVVFGADFDENWEVHHVGVETLTDVRRFMGSKYMQSRVGNTYHAAEQFLMAGRKVLYSGTPCQIKGLKGYLRKAYENLLTIDVVCHGAPSPGVWRKYFEEFRTNAASKAAAGKNTVLPLSLNDMSAIAGISFRDKQESGWKKFCFVVRKSASKADKNSVLLSVKCTKHTFMKGFFADVYLRPSCYACQAKGGKSGSDITLADFWGVHKVLPNWDDDKGTSLVAVHTEKGQQLFDSINMRKQSVASEQAFKWNPPYYSSVTMPTFRKQFYQEYSTCKSVSALIEKTVYVPSWLRFCRRVLGRVKRTLK